MNRYHIETHSKRCFTLEEAFSLARRCKSRADFLQADPSLYRWARQTGLLDSILPRKAEQAKRPNAPLTREQCLNQVVKYHNRGSLKRAYPTCYRRIKKQGWDDLFDRLGEALIEQDDTWAQEVG